MDVLRGRAPTPERDRETTARMLARTSERGEPAVRVWMPHPSIAFGRRDATADGYERARSITRDRGLVPLERSVGGRAVAYTGRTLAFAVALPSSTPRSGTARRYETATRALIETLRNSGAAVSEGEPDATFCPGDHSVRATDGGKIAGIAQRVRSDVALVAGCLIVTSGDRDAIADVLEPVYRALHVPFSPSSVGSVAAAGGPDDVSRVRDRIESALYGAEWSDLRNGNSETDARVIRFQPVRNGSAREESGSTRTGSTRTGPVRRESTEK